MFGVDPYYSWANDIILSDAEKPWQHWDDIRKRQSVHA